MNDSRPQIKRALSESRETAAGARLSASAIVQLVGINLLWAGSSAAAKSGLTSFGPFTLAALRFLPAGVLLWILARFEASHSNPRGFVPPPIRRSDFPGLFALGGSLAITYALFYTGLNGTTATDASLLTACEPILIAFFAMVVLKERLSRRQWGGLGLGLAGVWLIAGQSWGNGIALLSLAVESSVSVVAKRLTDSMSGLRIVACQMFIGAALLTPFAIWEIVQHRPVVTVQAVGGLAYLCLVNTVLCYGVWYHLLNRFRVSTMGAFILVQPMVGPLYGYLLRGEHLEMKSLAGGLLIVVGILFTAVAGLQNSSREVT